MKTRESKRTRAERAGRKAALWDRRRRHTVFIWNGVRITKRQPSPRKRRLERERQTREFWETIRTHGIAIVEVSVSPESSAHLASLCEPRLPAGNGGLAATPPPAP